MLKVYYTIRLVLFFVSSYKVKTRSDLLRVSYDTADVLLWLVAAVAVDRVCDDCAEAERVHANVGRCDNVSRRRAFHGAVLLASSFEPTPFSARLGHYESFRRY